MAYGAYDGVEWRTALCSRRAARVVTAAFRERAVAARRLALAARLRNAALFGAKSQAALAPLAASAIARA